MFGGMIVLPHYPLQKLDIQIPPPDATATDSRRKKVNLFGRWVMDGGHSSYGRMPVPKSCIEIIDQKEPAIMISTRSARRSEVVYEADD
jgi:hypothetical protein